MAKKMKSLRIINGLSKVKQANVRSLIGDVTDSINGREYERNIVSFLCRYGLDAHTTGNDDRGSDIIAVIHSGDKENYTFAIQCKFWNTSVGNSAVREAFAGAHAKGREGSFPVLITNNVVTAKARKSALELGVEIIGDIEWEELIESYVHFNVANKNRLGLLGILMGTVTSDHNHRAKCLDDLEKRSKVKQVGQQDADNTDVAGDYDEMLLLKQAAAEHDADNTGVADNYDEILLMEQEAAEHDRKASRLRQDIIRKQKEAALKILNAL